MCLINVIAMERTKPRFINSEKIILRPLKLSILISVAGELLLFIVWGLFLFPEGNIIHKLLWTVVFCGIGMGSSLGAIYIYLVHGQFWGWKAVMLCGIISTIVLGLFCNILCFKLDIHFNYFGGADAPALFIWSGVILSTVGGLLVGWLAYTKEGNRILAQVDL